MDIYGFLLFWHWEVLFPWHLFLTLWLLLCIAGPKERIAYEAWLCGDVQEFEYFTENLILDMEKAGLYEP